MDLIKSYGIPLLFHLNIYRKTGSGHLLGITFLWIFTVDVSVDKNHTNVIMGIGPLYLSTGIGIA